jgi:hypothetical protein
MASMIILILICLKCTNTVVYFDWKTVIIKYKILFPQGYVTFSDFDYPA